MGARLYHENVCRMWRTVYRPATRRGAARRSRVPWCYEWHTKTCPSMAYDTTRGDPTMAAKVHRSYRLAEETVDKLAAWAEEHGQTTTQAMESLLNRAIDGDVAEAERVDHEGETALLRKTIEGYEAQVDTLKEQRELMAANLLDLRETRATLTAQLTTKDEQIARLQDAVDHAQMLEAAQVRMAGSITAGADAAQDVPQDGTQQDEDQPRGIWAWLAKKIGR